MGEDCGHGSSEDLLSEYRRKKSHRCKVRSGAEVKTRPVIRTELWPHTITNEDDGENISSEDISLSKFLSCYTYIMINCVKVTEAEGRPVLLHAISTILECLPWAQARLFHNIMMLKIEQGRINWSADFTALAGQFLDKKVRMTLKTKSSLEARFSNANSARSSYAYSGRSYKRNNENTNFYNNRKDNFHSSRKNFVYYALCNQWNYGDCSYGRECKRWHVCRSCAAEGKLGEQHKASSHDNSTQSTTGVCQGNQPF